MANKFTRNQISVTELPLTMLSATETLKLTNAGKVAATEDEDLIYKYRNEFLQIQKVAAEGITKLTLLVDNPEELSKVAVGWGFTTILEDKFETKISYRKNLALTESVTKLSNITIDWTRPKAARVDVDLYRKTGNLVNTQDSTLVTPVSKLAQVKAKLGISEEETTVLNPALINLYNYGERYTYQITSSNIVRLTGSGTGAEFSIIVRASQSYGFGSAQNTGSGYAIGDRLKVLGSKLGGADGVNDAIITVISVGRTEPEVSPLVTGIILTATISGQASDNYLSGHAV